MTASLLDSCPAPRAPQWWEAYLGKAWAAVPDPPKSYTCGELCRAVLREQLGIQVPVVLADPAVLRECVENLEQPELYGLYPAAGAPREFDVAFLVRNKKRDHVGIAAMTAEGLMILHCQRGVGVILESPAEMLGLGYKYIDWRRHSRLNGEA